jgi:hypothetical protein
VQYRRPAIFTNEDREFAMVSIQPFVLWLFRPKRRPLHGPRLPLTGCTLCYPPMTYLRVYTPVSHLERHGRLHHNNSDGPLLDMEGDVIGVDKGIFSDISSGNNGLGLCHSL